MVKISCWDEIFLWTKFLLYLSWRYTNTLMLRLTQNMLIIKNGLKVCMDKCQRKGVQDLMLFWKKYHIFPLWTTLKPTKSTFYNITRKCVVKNSMRSWMSLLECKIYIWLNLWFKYTIECLQWIQFSNECTYGLNMMWSNQFSMLRMNLRWLNYT